MRTRIRALLLIAGIACAAVAIAQATVLLQREGFPRVANLNGGMLRWRADGHAVEMGEK